MPDRDQLLRTRNTDYNRIDGKPELDIHVVHNNLTNVACLTHENIGVYQGCRSETGYFSRVGSGSDSFLTVGSVSASVSGGICFLEGLSVSELTPSISATQPVSRTLVFTAWPKKTLI